MSLVLTLCETVERGGSSKQYGIDRVDKQQSQHSREEYRLLCNCSPGLAAGCRGD